MPNNDNLSQRELVELLERWKTEITGVVSDYKTSVASIDKAVDNLESQKRRWLVRYWWIISIVAIFITASIAMMVFQKSNSCDLTVGAQEFNLSLKKECAYEQKTIQETN